jgi:hypothetical protein
MKYSIAILTLAIAGCGGAAPRPTERTEMQYSGDRASRVLDWGDLERHEGTVVVVDGILGHIRGEHGIVTLDSGLNVYLPNLALYLRQQAWFDHLGKRVSVSGVLRAEGCTIPGYKGPSLQHLSGFSAQK